MRANANFLLAALITALVLAVIFAVGAITYAAYTRQTDRVDKVQAENTKLEHDHHIIGAKFAEQSQRLTKQSAQLNAAVAALNRAYRRGFKKGRRASTLPAPFSRLAPSVQQGYVVPTSVPRQLKAKPGVRRTPHGYTIRWPTVATVRERSRAAQRVDVEGVAEHGPQREDRPSDGAADGRPVRNGLRLARAEQDLRRPRDAPRRRARRPSGSRSRLEGFGGRRLSRETGGARLARAGATSREVACDV